MFIKKLKEAYKAYDNLLNGILPEGYNIPKTDAVLLNATFDDEENILTLNYMGKFGNKYQHKIKFNI